MKTTRDEISGFSFGYGLNVMRHLSFWGVICALCVTGPFCAVLSAQNYLTTTGVTSFSVPYPAEMGTVDAASGNLHLEIPLGSFPQRGGSALVPKLLYDSHIWTLPPDGLSPVWTPQGELYGLAFETWGFDEGGATGVYEIASSNQGCDWDGMLWSNSGVQHYFNITGTWNGTTCSGGTSYAVDSSGFQIRQTPWNNQGLHGVISVYAPDGTEVYGGDLYTNAITAKDPNGNYLGLTTATITPPGIFNPVIDTLGREVVAVPSTINPATLQVMNATGGTSTYYITYANIPVKTNFGQYGVAECNNNCVVMVITSVALPDGTSYSFLYDCDQTTRNTACNSPGGQSGYYGTLTSMTLPTGGTVTYQYETFEDALGNKGRWLTYKNNGTGWAWSYTPAVTSSGINLTQQVTVDKPDNSKDIISFALGFHLVNWWSYNGAWPTQILSYDANAALLSTVQNTWDFSNSCRLLICGQYDFEDVRKLSTSTTLPVPGGSMTKQTTYAYDSPQTGNVIAVKEWKYQSGSAPTFPSVPDRAAYTTYATIGANNNIDRPTSITVCNNAGTNGNCTAGGTPVAQTTITYDAYGSNGSLALAAANGFTNHDDTNFGTGYTARGNATQISRLVGGSTVLTTALSYDTTGQVVRVVDPQNHPTVYSYFDRFYNDNGVNPPQGFTPSKPTNAYVTQVTDAIGSTSMGYYYGSGQAALSTDYNAVTTYGHYVDPFDRLTKADYPIGWALNVYGVPSQGQTEVDSYAAVGDTSHTGSASCTLCTHTQALLDQFGRAVTGNLVNNPAGEVSVNSLYDGFNRVQSSSHPHMGASDPNNVYEHAYYDGLGRVRHIQHPDGGLASSAYGANVVNLGGLPTQQSSATTYGYGFPVVSLDEAGKQRQEWIDGFGHVIEVDEPSSTAATYSTATITVTGSEGSHSGYPDYGTVTITVNGFAESVSWGQGSTATFLADWIAEGFNADSFSGLSPVTAVSNGTTVTLTADGPGPLSISFSVSYQGVYTDYQITPASGTFTKGTGGLLTTPAVTTYTYDVLGNLTSVTQGAQTRSYRYDGLSRLTQEATPEAGTVTLSYVTTSGALCSGNPSTPCSRTAPAPNQTGTATVTTTYAYNAANQLKQKTHSDTTGTEVYTYGTNASNFNVGRLTKMTDPSGSEAYSYDQIGRVLYLNKVFGTTTYSTKYAYNAGSQVTKVTYPSGRVVYYNYDQVGHLCQVATSASSGCNATAPYLALPSSSYDAAGRPLSATYGNGVVATATYSPQTFELTSLGYAKGTTTLFGLNYYYQQNSTYCPTGNAVGNNGQIQCIADVSSGTGDSGRSVAYTYDQLGRLLTANTTGSTQYPAWGLSWTYDRYGNRTAQTVTAGSGYNSSFIINPVNNQITNPAFTYDASGNVIAEPSPLSVNYTYDGEECNTGYTGNGNTASYTCDGNHLRVKKVVTGTNAVTTVAIRSGGQVIAEYDNGAAVTSPTCEYLYGNSLLATVTGSTGGSGGTIIYQQRDHLSPRLYTDVNGNDVGEQGTYPFGESWYKNNTTSNWVFTSYERDQESGNDYALARSYANGQGRFLAPDPLEGVVGDPQSWNRYAYVENDPINLSDPSGQGFWEELANLLVEFFTGGQLSLDNGSGFGQEDPNITKCPPDICAIGTVLGGAVLIESSQGQKGGPHVDKEIWVPTGTGEDCNPDVCNATGQDGQGAPTGGGGTPAPGDNGAGSATPGGNGTPSPGSGSPAPGGGGTISNPSGGGIWNECDSCWRTVAWAGNFSAGAGDALTLGLTKFARKGTSWIFGHGYGENVNYRSGAYWGGAATGTAVGIALSGPKGPIFGGPQFKAFGYEGPGLLNRFESLRVGWSWMRGNPGFYRFRIGGDLVGHINLWPPRLWFW